MISDEATIIVVDDDREMASMLCDILRDAGHHAITASSAAQALELAEQEPPDLLITDLRMSGMSGHQLQGELKQRHPKVPVIVITAFGSIANAVESMKLGAFDYLTKPFGNDELLLVVGRALENRELHQEIGRLREELARTYGVSNIIAANPRMLALLEIIKQVADSPANVLISGESGTGKELLARALHFSSSRRSAPFVPINCAAIPENLIESELFGYVKGAFTDARSGRNGLFQSARGGTLFLDEIGEMPPALQAKLLRVIEDKRVRPLGSTEEMPVELRVVAATNIDLEQAIAAGKFRRDLYYRLATVAIEVPPLRERPQDLGLLIRYFLVRAANEAGKKVPCLAPEVLECFRRYAWPGNVRELQNVIQGSMLLCRKDSLTMADLPGRLVGKANAAAGSLAEAAARRLSLEEIERAYVRLVMDQAANNKTEAAAILQIDRKTLYRKLEERDELAEC